MPFNLKDDLVIYSSREYTDFNDTLHFLRKENPLDNNNPYIKFKAKIIIEDRYGGYGNIKNYDRHYVSVEIISIMKCRYISSFFRRIASENPLSIILKSTINNVSIEELKENWVTGFLLIEEPYINNMKEVLSPKIKMAELLFNDNSRLSKNLARFGRDFVEKAYVAESLGYLASFERSKRLNAAMTTFTFYGITMKKEVSDVDFAKMLSSLTPSDFGFRSSDSVEQILKRLEDISDLLATVYGGKGDESKENESRHLSQSKVLWREIDGIFKSNGIKVKRDADGESYMKNLTTYFWNKNTGKS